MGVYCVCVSGKRLGFSVISAVVLSASQLRSSFAVLMRKKRTRCQLGAILRPLLRAARLSAVVMLRLRRPLRSASTLLLFGSARSFSLLGPLSSRLRPPFNLRVRCQASLPDSEEGWRTLLTPSQFSVLRNAATEPSGYSENKEGELEYKLKTELKTKYPADGAYCCVGCATPLYYARSKFNSGCGWPAFYDGVPGAIEEKPDPDGSRIEIVCHTCKGHLGHVFKNENFPTPTNERHCIPAPLSWAGGASGPAAWAVVKAQPGAFAAFAHPLAPLTAHKLRPRRQSCASIPQVSTESACDTTRSLSSRTTSRPCPA